MKSALQVGTDGALVAACLIAAARPRFERFDFSDDVPLLLSFARAGASTLIALHFLSLYQAVVRLVTGKILIVVGGGVFV